MARLSSPIGALKDHYTVVVVGSGYGGGISASRLARAGQQVCVLERGKEFQPGEYPKTNKAAFDEIQMDIWRSPRIKGPRTGLYDLRFNEDMNVFIGCGLGGTSLVNANVCMEAEDKVFEQSEWPEEIRDPTKKGLAELAKGYRLARDMLKPEPYDSRTDSTKFPPLLKQNALEKCAAHLGEQYKPTPINVTFARFPNDINHVGVEQHACVRCGDCMTGCNYHAKNTVIMNYLPDAKNHGAEIFTKVSVRYLERKDARWLVHYHLVRSGWLARLLGLFRSDDDDATTKSISADIVILAAGTLGSTEILLRSQQKGLALSGRVGQNFSGNGDVLAFGYNNDEKINAIGLGPLSPEGREPVGPCISGIIDARGKANLRDSFVIEEATISGAFAPQLPNLFAAAAGLAGRDTDPGFADWLREKWRKFVGLLPRERYEKGHHGAVQNTLPLIVIGHDDRKGVMSLRNNRLRIKWEGVGDQPNVNLANQKIAGATAALGGTYLTNPITNEISGHDLITVHPLGGCVMADSAADGVVNHKGQVFSGPTGTNTYDSLYVSDGSVIPRPLGINPLLTISAVAERCVALLANERGWTIDYSPISQPW